MLTLKHKFKKVNHSEYFKIFPLESSAIIVIPLFANCTGRINVRLLLFLTNSHECMTRPSSLLN